MRVIEKLELRLAWLREHAERDRGEGNQECGGDAHGKR
jgi:hypothetical protein